MSLASTAQSFQAKINAIAQAASMSGEDVNDEYTELETVATDGD